MLQRYQAPYTLRVLEQWGKGAATARNHGASSARGHWLIFIDDDIEPIPGFIEAHISAHKRHSGQVVIGYLGTIIPKPHDFYQMQVRRWWESKFCAMRQAGHRFNYLDLLSGNFSLEAKLFKRLGGFDTRFPGCGGEDYEFGVRLIKSGATFTFAPEAMGYHHEKTDLDRSFRRARKEGQADVMIGRRHPELIPALFISQIYSPWTWLARILAALIFKLPAGGDLLAKFFRRVLNLQERLRMRGRWLKLYGVLRGYWYWRGAGEELGTRHELNRFLNGISTCDGPSNHEFELDIRGGLEVAEKRLNKVRPASATIRYGQHYIGRIPPEAGAERLRGAHLRPILANGFTWPVLIAIAVEGAMNSAAEEVRLLVSTESLDSKKAGSISSSRGTRKKLNANKTGRT
jgi:GT2 family glycosyltransferase